MVDRRHLLFILPYSIFQARNRRRRIHGFLSIIQIARRLRTQTIAMLTATMMMALHMPQEDTFPRAQHRCSQGPSFGVSQCSTSWYTTTTHIGPNSFNFIVQLLCATTDKRNTRLQDAISIKKRVAVALWRLATGNSYRTISSTFGMGKSTAIQITNEFLDAINALYGDWIKFRDSSRHGRIY